MTFQQLVEWQWSDYSDHHRDRNNLLIHIVAVPLFWIAAFEVLGCFLLMLAGVPFIRMLFWALVLGGGAILAQAIGNAFESSPPAKPGNVTEFARRVIVEQFFTFPRFVLSGQWWSNLKASL